MRAAGSMLPAARPAVIEGFGEFSRPRGVVVRGTGGLAGAFLPVSPAAGGGAGPRTASP